MNSLTKIGLVLAVALPVQSLSAVTVIRGHGSSRRGGRVVAYENVYHAPSIRIERQVVDRTRHIGNDSFGVCVTRPVVEYRTVVERPYLERVVVYEPQRRRHNDRAYYSPKRHKRGKRIVKILSNLVRLARHRDHDRGDRYDRRDRGDRRERRAVVASTSQGRGGRRVRR